MKKHKIKEYIVTGVNTESGEYIVQDTEGRMQSINIRFIDIEQSILKGDNICLSEEYFNRKSEWWTYCFCFGKLSDSSGRDVSNVNLDESEEIILIKQGEKQIHLKRLYG
jgi:hypothetical protein